jgi:hypothetical protein
MQHPAFWGQPMSAEQSFNIHNTFPLPIGASRAEPVSHTQYVQLPRLDCLWTKLTSRQPLVTGTSVLGIKYKDGVMLAADNLGKLVKLLKLDQADDSLVWIPCSIQGYPETASSW